MSRLQKKCFIGAAGMHLLLLTVLAVGPAFLVPNKVNNSPVIEFVPMLLTDEQISGGGTPRPPAPQPQPQPPQPSPPQPQPVRQPEPPKPAPAPETRPNPAAIDPKPERKPHQVKISTTVVNLKPTTQTSQPARTPTTSQANVYSQVANQLRESVKTTQIEMPEGPGGGGVSYANYAQEVRRVYTEAWRIPPDVNDDEATVRVSVTIARNGKVVESRIVQRSSSPAVDRSIQATLERVTFVAPFPTGAKEAQRTFTISFNLKAKKLFG